MIIVAQTAVRLDNRYLLIQRVLADSYGGLWAFPGGGQEDNETIEETAVRELREEVGIVPTKLTELFQIRSSQDNKEYLTHIFLCKQFAGLPRLATEEIIGFGWFTIPEIWKLDKSLTPWTMKCLPQLSFLVRHDHRSNSNV